jgi:hypothetical protein
MNKWKVTGVVAVAVGFLIVAAVVGLVVAGSEWTLLKGGGLAWGLVLVAGGVWRLVTKPPPGPPGGGG